MSKIVLGIGLGIVLVAGAFGVYAVFLRDSVELVEIEPVEQVTFSDIVAQEDEIVPTEIEDEPELPEEGDGELSSFNLAVPFSSQAPTGNWNLPYQEACEETSMYMVSQYYSGITSPTLDPAQTELEIQSLVSFQDDLIGYHLDTTALETVQVMDAFYGIGGTIVENPTVEMIKDEIAAGRPVIVPAAGKKLPNPYFSGEGPVYHMLVVKGYTEGTFITNDPGTRNGADFVYRQSDLMAAIGDWNDGDPVNGKKLVIFTSP